MKQAKIIVILIAIITSMLALRVDAFSGRTTRVNIVKKFMNHITPSKKSGVTSQA